MTEETSTTDATTRRSFLAQTAGLLMGAGLPAAVVPAAETASTASWSSLEQRIRGRLILPSSPDYDSARKVWNQSIDRHPAAVLQCSNIADVVEGVRFAAAAGLKVSVRCGGHNVAGRSVQNDALLLDLAALNGIQIDTRSRRVEAGGGALLRDLDRATGRFGLAVPVGMVGDTGIGGLTLGGGIGWLMRRHGLTVDNLLSAHVVLASGKEVEVSATQNAELFWALRGGGGNVGVVTRFTYRAYPVTTILGAQLAFRAEHAPKVMRAYRELCATAPDELTTVALATMVKPDSPIVPLRGQAVIGVGACWCGDIEAGMKILAPLRAAAPMEMDVAKPVPFAAMQASGDGAGKRTVHTWWESRNLPALGDAAIDAFAAQALSLPTPFTEIHCHQLGGAVSRGDQGDAAADLRRNAFVINAIGASERPDDLGMLSDWSRRTVQSFGIAQAKTYVNFSSANAAFSKQSYTDDIRARLATIKRRYDPTSLFV